MRRQQGRRRSARRSTSRDAEIYAIDVSFAALADPAERAYLNQQPTSFVLPAEAVDRLRKAAGTIIQASPEFQRLLKDVGARIVAEPSGGKTRARAVTRSTPAAGTGVSRRRRVGRRRGRVIAARMPCSSAVGVGGQPGIATSTGITLATRPRLA